MELLVLNRYNAYMEKGGFEDVAETQFAWRIGKRARGKMMKARDAVYGRFTSRLTGYEHCGYDEGAGYDA